MVRLEIVVTTSADGRTAIQSEIQGKGSSLEEYTLFFAKSRREFDSALAEMIDTLYTDTEEVGWRSRLDTDKE